MKRLAVMLIPLAALAIACSDDDDGSDAEPVSACETAVDEGGNADALVDENTNLDAAIEVCPSYDALEAATETFPDALGGQDLATLVTERCAAGISGAACDGVDGG